MKHQRVTVKRSTREGDIETPAIKIGPLAVCKFPLRDVFLYTDFNDDPYGILHIETGFAVPGVYRAKQSEAIAIAEKLAPFPEWSKLKRNGKTVKVSDKQKKKFAVKISEATA